MHFALTIFLGVLFLISPAYPRDASSIHIYTGVLTGSPIVLKPGVLEFSPVEILLTDPQGRRTGFDPNSSFTHEGVPQVREIPNSFYSTESIASDDPSNPVFTPETKVIEIMRPTAGDYAAEVIGKNDGIYNMEIDLVQSDKSRDMIKIDGVSSAGTHQQIQIQYSPVPGEPVGVRKIVTFASLTEEIKIARRLNLIKNDGIRTSLLAKVSSAQQAKDRNQPTTAGNVLNALLKEISAQKEKGIDKTAVSIFTESIQALLSELRQ